MDPACILKIKAERLRDTLHQHRDLHRREGAGFPNSRYRSRCISVVLLFWVVAWPSSPTNQGAWGSSLWPAHCLWTIKSSSSPHIWHMSEDPPRKFFGSNVTNSFWTLETLGKLVFSWQDDGKILGEGRIGLRTMARTGKASYVSFKVWEVTQTDWDTRWLPA